MGTPASSGATFRYQLGSDHSPRTSPRTTSPIGSLPRPCSRASLLKRAPLCGLASKSATNMINQVVAQITALEKTTIPCPNPGGWAEGRWNLADKPTTVRPLRPEHPDSIESFALRFVIECEQLLAERRCLELKRFPATRRRRKRQFRSLWLLAITKPVSTRGLIPGTTQQACLNAPAARLPNQTAHARRRRTATLHSEHQ